MAEYERRGGDHYRGGGGGGGGGGRKRRFREFDEYDRRPPRRDFREYRESPATRARRSILAIADNPLRNAREDATDLAKLVTQHHDDEYLVRHISELLPQIVVEQPLKIPYIAAIFLNIFHQRPEIVGSFLDVVKERIQTALSNGEWRPFKLLLRYVACVNSIFEGDGLFAMLEELFNRAVDLQTESADDAVGLEIVRIILLTIPYALVVSSPNAGQKAAEILEKTDIMASAALPMEEDVNPYVGTDEDISRPTNVLALLQKQLQAEAAKDWALSFIPRPFPDTNPQNGENAEAPPAKPAFPTVEVPQTINPGPNTLFPQIFFSLYADQDIETVPPTTNLASSLIRDSLADTINVLDFNRIETARFLVDMDQFWAAGTFVPRGTPFDNLKNMSEDSSTWKSEDLAVDAVFSQMLLLPHPEHKLVYYHSLITEACKVAPVTAPSLGRAIRFLYRSLDFLDQDLSYRFMNWFAHHLSNFDFRWKWMEWVEDVNLSDLHPRKAFIQAVLDKEIRLSFAQRIRENIPGEYHPLIPKTRDAEIPEFKFKHENTPYSSEGKQLLRLLQSKAPEADMQAPLDSIQNAEAVRLADASDAEPKQTLLASTDAYMTALCYIGSKSLSHILSFIERHKERLVSLGPIYPPLRTQIIDSVVQYWKPVQPSVAVYIIDKLLNYSIVTPGSVIDWALTNPESLNGGRTLNDSWRYEMVTDTLAKVTNRVRQIVAARNKEGLPPDQVKTLDETLDREVQDMKALFANVDDALVGVAQGSNDVMQQDNLGEAMGQGGEEVNGAEEFELLKGWGARWLRVFKRKLNVEEKVVRETMLRFPPPGEEVIMKDGDDEEQAAKDGVNGDANGDAEEAAADARGGFKDVMTDKSVMDDGAGTDVGERILNNPDVEGEEGV